MIIFRNDVQLDKGSKKNLKALMYVTITTCIMYILLNIVFGGLFDIFTEMYTVLYWCVGLCSIVQISQQRGVYELGVSPTLSSSNFWRGVTIPSNISQQKDKQRLLDSLSECPGRHKQGSGGMCLDPLFNYY